MKHFLLITTLLGAALGASAKERNLGVVGLTPTDSARVSVTQNDVEPLWIDVRYYDTEGKMLKEERLTVRPKQIRYVDLSGGEARVNSGGSRVQVRVAVEVVGSPDGMIIGDSEFASASLEVVDHVTGKSIAVMQSEMKK